MTYEGHILFSSDYYWTHFWYVESNIVRPKSLEDSKPYGSRSGLELESKSFLIILSAVSY